MKISIKKHRHACAGLICRVILVLAILCWAAPAPALAQAPVEPQMGAALKELGLFKGTDYGLELEKPCDRLMGAVILTRLLGREQEALNGAFSHPFSDVTGTYADPYIGYLYSQGLSNGVSAAAYGRENMTGQQFAVLILRVLGYVDGVDFTWEGALSFTARLGILAPAEAEALNSGGFLRAQAVLLCYRALLTSPKEATRPLAHQMLWEDVFSARQLAKSQDAQLLLAADMPDAMTFAVNVSTEQQFMDIVWLALRNSQGGLAVQAPFLSQERAQELINELLSLYFPRDFMIEFILGENNTFYLSFYIGEYMSMQFYFREPDRYAKNFQFYEEKYRQKLNGFISMHVWKQKIEDLVAEIIPADASEYERVKAAHDYLVLNTSYDEGADDNSISHFAEGVLYGNKGVCDGFASAFKMLMNGAGVECRVIYGTSLDDLHAWNQVKIDGQWYNLDVTWATTVDEGRGVYYGYFCAPDSIFLRDHTPEKEGIAQPCTSTLYYSPPEAH